MILPSSQVITRPILLGDNADVTADGPIRAQCTPALVVGVKEVSPDHYPTSSITGKTAYRTLGSARLALPGDAWDMGSQQLTIEFTVEQNTPATGQVGLFGFIRNQRPSPWYCAVVDGRFRFAHQLADGSVEIFSAAWPPGGVAGRVSIDPTKGAATINLNGMTTGYAILPTFKLAPRDTPYFGVGAIADRAYGWGDYVGGPHDWTYHSLKVTGGPSSGPNVNEASTPFCRLLCDAPGPVCCYNGSHVFGFMLDTAQGNANRVRIHDISITSSLTAGPLIAVGGCYSPTFERLTLQGGGQSIASLGGLWSYPVRLIDCELGAPYYGWGQSVWMDRTNFQYANPAGEFSHCFVAMDKTFVAGSPKGGKMFRFQDESMVSPGVGQADYEGLQPSSYFEFDASSKVCTGWIKGRNTPIVLP